MCVYIYMYMHMYMYTHMYVYIYIYTYIHMIMPFPASSLTLSTPSKFASRPRKTDSALSNAPTPGLHNKIPANKIFANKYHIL